MYCLLSQAREFVRAGSGECSKDALTDIVNRIRRDFYNWHSEVQLFVDVVEAFAVQNFCTSPEGGERFSGITLPREMATIESMWWNDWPITLRSSWREWQAGISPCCDCGLQKFDLPGYFSTALDLIPGHPQKVRFQCYNAADVGKTVIIRGVSISGAPFQERCTLSISPKETSVALSSIDRQGGVIKDVTLGRVALSEANGRILGMYEPDETVASYRRVKISGLRAWCDHVNVRAARRYFPLVDDNDVVETDNAPAFDSMARYLRSYQNSSKTSEDLRIEKDHWTTARGHILGEKSRELGKSTRAEIKVVTPSMIPVRARLSSSRYYGGRY